MNLVLGMLMLGGSSLLVWGGLTDPEGGILAGIRNSMTGQPNAKHVSTIGAALVQSVAQLGGTGTAAAPATGTPGVAPAADTGKYKLGSVRPWVAAAAKEIGGRFGIKTVYGFSYRNIAGTSTLSDHALGLALDFMTNDAGTRAAIANYAQTNAGRLGVTYVIHDRLIWSVARNREGWRHYSGVNPHTDHTHVSFLAVAPISGAAAKAAKPGHLASPTAPAGGVVGA